MLFYVLQEKKNQQEMENGKKKAERQFSCSRCLNLFSNKFSLRRHLLTCCKCKICKEVLSDKNSFENHKKNCNQYFDCQYCSKSFLNNKKLADHLKNCSAMFCTACQKLFPSPESLEKHYDSHKTLELFKSSKKSSYTCAQCGLEFNNLESLKTHEINENHARAGGSSEKPPRNYDCRKCKRTFPNRSELYYHQRLQHDQIGGGSGEKLNF